MIIDKLEEIKAHALYRQLNYFESPQTPHVILGGKEYLMLSSNSYLGLCNDERLKQAAITAIEKYGVGSGGSRLITGSYDIHRKLEQGIAAFKKTEAALVFNTGYMANVGTISSLADKDWVIFSDSLNHASIIDGCRLSGAETVVYRHLDMDDLRDKVEEYQGRPALIVTDGLFSVDGDIAPVPDIVEIARKHNILVMVDDAHATGVLGASGGGTSDYFGLKDGSVDIQMGTLSKALASEGGFVAGKQCLIDYLINRARSFIFSTALAPATIAVSLEALAIISSEPESRITLNANAGWVRSELRAAGFDIIDSPTPIISLILGDPALTVRFSKKLLEEGLYVSAIRPPTVPHGTSRLRISIMATHKRDDLASAVKIIKETGRELGILTKKNNGV
ncbi:MAG: 8-amino-7-oxononanoate synthase [Syntrophales bacterium]|nr:8-amino-7-oxononanoate synthase [Syntrophales bacterium]